jgi:hypothetical protein
MAALIILDQTEAAASRSLLHRIFSFPVAISALLVVLAVFTARGRLSDPDLWWHLRTGELIWNTHSIPHVDPFSFTVAGHPWTAQEWLSQLTLYAVYRLGGYAGLMIWLCVMTSLIVVGGYLLSALYSGNVKLAFLGGMTTWLFATTGVSVRPQLIGYVLLIVELLILHLGRTRHARWLFALPPLFALWINVHSSFLFGLMVFAIVLVCSFLNLRWGLLVAVPGERRTRGALTISFALSLAALFLNPLGAKLIWYPLDVLFRQPMNLGLITEWQPDFSPARGWALLAVSCLVLLIPLLRRVELQLDEFLLTALPFYFAVRHMRMEFPFGILVAPIVCRLLAGAWEQYKPERDRLWPNALVLALAAFTVFLAFPRPRNLASQMEKANPVKALAYIRRSGLAGRMLNDYAFGGYLLWAAPERKVFIDPRADLYDPAGILKEYARFISLAEDPRPMLDKYRIDFCLLAPDEPVARVLQFLPGWKKVYSDGQAAVLARQN